MRGVPRRLSFVAAVTITLIFGCRSQPRTDVAIHVVDQEHGVKIADIPALLIGGYGDGRGQVKQVGPVTVDGDGNVLIADNRLRRITVIGETGKVSGIRSYLPNGENPLVAPDSLRSVQAMTWGDSALYVVSGDELWTIRGSGARKVSIASLGGSLRDIAVGPNGRIYALTDDYYKVYDKAGTVQDSIGFVREQLGSPSARSFALGPDGKVYVSARTWGRVLVYTSEGELAGEIGGRGDQPEQFKGQAKGIAVDGLGTIFVRDDGANAIKVFRADGSLVANVGSRGSEPGQSLSGNQVVLDQARHRLLLPDEANFRVQIYDLTGRDTDATNLVAHSPEYLLTYRPSQIALALGEDTRTERRIAWKTDAATVGTQVVYVRADGSDPSGVDWNSPSVKTARGTNVVFHSNLGPYAAHKVALRDLVPGARYAYRVGDGSPEGWSGVAQFSVAERPDERITVVVLGDSRNRMDVWREIITKASARKPAFVINTGDLVRDGEDMNDWNAWFYEARDILNTIPIMPCLGNHERQSPNYFNSFALPENAEGELRGQCYSFDYGPAHWIVLNTELDLNKQARWLERDLIRNTKPWTFVFFHRPAYAGHPTRGDGNRDVREAWEQLLDDHGVAIVWQGHDHYYYRTKPISAGEVVEEGAGPVYVTTGGAGAPLYPIQINQYTAVAESVDHYCVMTVTEAVCTVTVYRRDESVLDRFTLRPRLPMTFQGRTGTDLDRLETGE